MKEYYYVTHSMRKGTGRTNFDPEGGPQLLSFPPYTCITDSTDSVAATTKIIAYSSLQGLQTSLARPGSTLIIRLGSRCFSCLQLGGVWGQLYPHGRQNKVPPIITQALILLARVRCMSAL